MTPDPREWHVVSYDIVPLRRRPGQSWPAARYDPQLEAAVSDLTTAGRDEAVSMFGKVAKMFDRRGYRR
jgi:hypothetical protein